MKNIQIFSRQTDRAILIALGVMVLAVAPMLIVDSYKSNKEFHEHERMYAVKEVVAQKVEAYYQATGHYPDSLGVLTFTNSPQEIEMSSDLKKIRYWRTQSHYQIAW